MTWRRWLVPAAAVLCVPVAVMLVLLAVDVLRVSGSVTRDDVRFQARPTLPSGLFDEPGVLPGAVASKAVGLGDDLRYRRAVWLYARVEPDKVAIVTPQLEALQASLEPKLIDASRAESDPARRSKLLNLLGVVTMGRYAADPADRNNIVRGARDAFQSAITADPDNADAKFNLELLHRDFLNPVATGQSPDRGRLGGRTAGVGRDGSGY